MRYAPRALRGYGWLGREVRSATKIALRDGLGRTSPGSWEDHKRIELVNAAVRWALAPVLPCRGDGRKARLQVALERVRVLEGAARLGGENATRTFVGLEALP